MAIKVSGTTVINDSRELNNITSVDATTVAALGAAGVGGGGGIELTTSEAVVEGDPLSFNFSTGKVEKTGRIGGTVHMSNFGISNFTAVDAIYIPEIDKTAVLLYSSDNNRMEVYLAAQNATTGAFTWGTGQTLSSGNNDGTTLVYDSNVDRLVVFYRSGSTLYCRLFSTSGNNLTSTSTVTVSTSVNINSTYTLAAHHCPSDNRTYIMYTNSSGDAVTRVGTIGASSQSWSSEAGANSNSRFDDDYPSGMAITSVGSTILFHWQDPPFNPKMVVAGTWDGSSWTWGSEHTLYTDGSNSHGRAMAFRLSGSTVSNLCAWLFQAGNNTYVGQYTVSGTTISTYSVGQVESNGGYGHVGGYDADNDLYYGFTVYSSNGYLKYSTQGYNTWTTNGTDTVFTNNNNNINLGTLNTETGYFIFGLEDSNYLYAHKPIVDNYLTFVGVAAESASANSTVKINNAGNIATGLSGLTAGNGYRIKFDGTFENLGSGTNFLSAGNRGRTSGVALTSTTMLLINDMLHTS